MLEPIPQNRISSIDCLNLLSRKSSSAEFEIDLGTFPDQHDESICIEKMENNMKLLSEKFQLISIRYAFEHEVHIPTTEETCRLSRDNSSRSLEDHHDFKSHPIFNKNVELTNANWGRLSMNTPRESQLTGLRTNDSSIFNKFF